MLKRENKTDPQRKDNSKIQEHMPNEGERDQNVLKTVLQHGNEEHQEKPGASSLHSQANKRSNACPKSFQKNLFKRRPSAHRAGRAMPHNTERGQTHSLTAWGSGDS